MVDTEETGQVQKETESTEETKELIIETETENGVESGKQEIQQTPEKTEDEKPEEPPALTEDADTTKPDTPVRGMWKSESGTVRPLPQRQAWQEITSRYCLTITDQTPGIPVLWRLPRPLHQH